MSRAMRSSRAIPQPRYNACPLSHKVGYVTVESARMGAHRMSRHMNQRGTLVESIYSYRCDGCSRLHLTRMSAFPGRGDNHLILRAADVETQLWAMDDVKRAAAIARLEGDDPLLGLPDPRPVASSGRYANRPAHLRSPR